MTMSSEGSSCLRKLPKVALMIPAPIRTMSGRSEPLVSGMQAPLSIASPNDRREAGSRLLAPERNRRVLRQDHVRATPGLIADQPPAMAGAGGILGEQDIAGSDREGLL